MPERVTTGSEPRQFTLYRDLDDPSWKVADEDIERDGIALAGTEQVEVIEVVEQNDDGDSDEH